MSQLSKDLLFVNCATLAIHFLSGPFPGVVAPFVLWTMIIVERFAR